MTVDAIGGVWRYAIDLAAALVAHDVTTVLAVLGPPASPAQRIEARGLAGLKLVETGLPLDWLSDGPDPVLAAGKAIAALATREAVDLVHLNMPSLGAAAFDVPVVAVIHGCVGTWWEAARGTCPDPGYVWQDALVRAGLAAAAATIAPSASYAATVARYHALSQVPVAIHNGCAASAPGAKTEPARHVFTAGRLWDQVKNTALLDRVAGRIDVPFRAAGQERGPHGETMKLRHLRPLGQLDAKAMAAERAARPIFVSAARFEPFGLAVLEAASAGCPLILSGIDTFRELWTGAALIVDEDDDEAYAAAIARVLGDPALRAELGEAARTRAGRYTPAAMAAATAAIYSRIGSSTLSRKVAA